jgi:hypothetical protein
MAFGMRRTVAWLLVLLTLSSWCLLMHASVTENKHRHLLGGKSTGVHRRQTNATSFIAVTGIGYLADDVAIHPRLEIRELERRPDEFNVFLLGLRRWMEVSQDQKESYFQIAGKEISAKMSSVMVSELAYNVQVFMADPTSHGTVSKHPTRSRWATADIAATYFQRGIGPTWRWSR